MVIVLFISHGNMHLKL